MGHLFLSNRRLAWHHRSTAVTSSYNNPLCDAIPLKGQRSLKTGPGHIRAASRSCYLMALCEPWTCWSVASPLLPMASSLQLSPQLESLTIATGVMIALAWAWGLASCRLLTCSGERCCRSRHRPLSPSSFVLHRIQE